MRLSLSNVGKIKSADIDIHGIAVIAGENASGKSTVGKALFCVLNSLNRMNEQIEGNLKQRVHSVLYQQLIEEDEDLIDPIYSNLAHLSSSCVKNKQSFANDKQELSTFINSKIDELGLSKKIPYEKKESIADRIYDILMITKEEALSAVMRSRFQLEFKMKLNHIRRPSEASSITLSVREKEIVVSITDNEKVSLSGNASFDDEAIYIDNPFVLNRINIPRNRSHTHEGHLCSCLSIETSPESVETAIDGILISKRLKRVFSKLNTVCSGEMSLFKGRIAVYEDEEGYSFDMVNVSTGLKTFIIIKTLLSNGSLKENGVLILDEPEIHLHPEWQLDFAELIVLLHKEYNIHILLTTHSHYFLDAIDVYSKKHEIIEKCKYYIAENEGKDAVINDATGNLESIFSKFAKPLRYLEDTRYNND
ncbi:MAG: ATP-binding protein [Oscillospiraceae bacterium]|nr:ATP-binding protein [Oscillospiraceae bacterium]